MSALPTPTKDKRVRRWLAGSGPRVKERLLEYPARVEIPALDMAALQRKYSPEEGERPRVLTGTFRAPAVCTEAQFEQLARRAVGLFVKTMDQQGWDLKGSVKLTPGVYPARDLLSGVPLLDEREIIVRAPFALRRPKPVRIELPPEMREPFAVGVGAA